LTNTLRLAAINSVGDFVLFIGKIATVAVITIVGIEFISVSYNYVVSVFFLFLK
jgi:solute carrier family 44 protein 1 (choline transporter-like protein)